MDTFDWMFRRAGCPTGSTHPYILNNMLSGTNSVCILDYYNFILELMLDNFQTALNWTSRT